MDGETMSQNVTEARARSGSALNDALLVSVALTAMAFGSIFVVRAIDIALDAFVR